jgi:signal transduction histidine kinase
LELSMISTGELAGAVVAVVGGLLLWANPTRKVNRAIFASSTVVAAWLAFTQLAQLAQPERGLIWVRWATAAGGLAPLTLWMVKESIVGTFEFRSRAWLRKSIPWFMVAILLATVPFTELFIPFHSTPENRLRGPGYWPYYGVASAAYALLGWQSIKVLRTLSGARKVELQVWLLGGTAIATLIHLFIVLGWITHDLIYRKLQPIAVLVFYAGTAYAITSNRLFDARQIFMVGLEKLTLVVSATVAAYIVSEVVGGILSETATLLTTTAIVVLATGKFNSWLDRKFQFVQHADVARKEAFSIAQRETRLDALDQSYVRLLKGWGQSEIATILTGSKTALAGGTIELSFASVEIQTMATLRWATPERLSRERQTKERQQVASLLSKYGWGVLLFEQGTSLSILIGVGVSASRRPYTYPQVAQLMELASIIHAAFERAHFSAKAQQAEQLATVGLLGASVAHEIRNPLVTIKTFVQLLPTHYNDQNFREKFFKLIGDEVSRIDGLTEQLLDLSAPRVYSAQSIELHALLQSGVDLVSSKAAHRQVELITEFSANPDRAFTDASAAKQVMLNLCFNAIQAIETHDSDKRWVKIATRNIDKGIEVVVADSGPGISPDMWPRLFQPFQTTKSSGFGLGLATCSDILNHLQATIKVDPPEPGRGATFRVIFPCQPLSS